MGEGHPECPDRVRVISDRLLTSGLLDLLEPVEAPPATREQLLRAHTGLHVSEIEARSPINGYARVDPDTVMNARTLLAARHAAGAAVRGDRDGGLGRGAAGLLQRPPAGPSCNPRSVDGVLLLQQRRRRLRHALDELGLERVALVRLRRASRQRQRRHLRRRRARADAVDLPVAALSVFGREAELPATSSACRSRLTAAARQLRKAVTDALDAGNRALQAADVLRLRRIRRASR